MGLKRKRGRGSVGQFGGRKGKGEYVVIIISKKFKEILKRIKRNLQSQMTEIHVTEVKFLQKEPNCFGLFLFLTKAPHCPLLNLT